MTHRRWPVFLIAAVAASGAAAQVMSNPGQWYINNQIYSTRVFNSTVGTSMVTAPGSRAASAAPSAAARDVTRFVATPASLLPGVLAAREGGSAAAQRQARARYDGYVELYRSTAKKDGFPADDLAYAYQYFVVNNYQIVHDLMDLPPEQDPRLRQARDGFARIEAAGLKRQQQVNPMQERAVYRQFRASLAAQADIARMTDAQKQEAAEMLAISYGVNLSAYLAGVQRGDDALAQQSRDQARQGLEKLIGRPLARIRIDERGIAE